MRHCHCRVWMQLAGVAAVVELLPWGVWWQGGARGYRLCAVHAVCFFVFRRARHSVWATYTGCCSGWPLGCRRKLFALACRLRLQECRLCDVGLR
eukprot:886354-Rhodomonas_salina.3